jgi:hypothetical protein
MAKLTETKVVDEEHEWAALIYIRMRWIMMMMISWRDLYRETQYSTLQQADRATAK